MKKTLMLALALLPTALPCLGQGAPETDTAARVIDTYLRMLNPEGLPADSMLVMETAVTTHGSQDTTFMRRWYAAPEQFRVEVEHGGYLQFALYCNGRDIYRQFNPHTSEWSDIERDHFLNHLSGYDFRTPLYGWRTKQSKLTWSGHTTLKGQRLEVVKVEMEGFFDRYYMFDPQNGLLTLVIETLPNSEASYQRSNASHIDWKTYHEYQPVGPMLVSSLESFMRDGTLTILQTTARFEARNESRFNKE